MAAVKSKSKQGAIVGALTRKLGPAPAWAWLGGFAVAVWWYRNRQGSGTVTTPATDTSGSLLDSLPPGSTVTIGDGSGGSGAPPPTPTPVPGGPKPKKPPKKRPKRRQHKPRAKQPDKTKTHHKPPPRHTQGRTPAVSHPRSAARSAAKQRTPLLRSYSGGGSRRVAS